MLKSADVQSWSWRLLRIIAAAFLGVVCFGIGIRPTIEALRRYLPEQASYCRPSDGEWRIVDDMLHADGADYTVRLDATPDQVSGWMSVKLPIRHISILHRTMARASSCMRWNWIAQRYSGYVNIGDRQMEYASVTFRLPRGKAYGFVDVVLEPTPIQIDKSPIGVTVKRGYQARAGQTTTHIETRGGWKVISRSATPIEQSNGATEFITHGDTDLVLMNLAPPPRREERRRRVTEVLLSYDAKYRNVIQPLINGFIYSIPFVLLIALYRRLRIKPPLDESTEAISVSIAFIVLILGVEITNAAFDLYFGPFEWLRTRVLEDCYNTFLSPSGAAAIGAAFVIWYWPLYMHRARAGRSGTESPATRKQLWFLTIVTTVATIISALGMCGWREEWFFSHLTVPILGSVAAIFCVAAISSEFTSDNWALFDGVTTVLVAIGLELLGVFFPASSILRFAIVGLLALPMVFSILRLLRPSWPTSALVGLSSAICAVLVVSRFPHDDLWWEAVVSSLASSLSPALRFAAVVYLWRLLKRLSKQGVWNELEDDERDAGFVLALTFFFLPPAHRWLYVVVVFAVGWLVLKKWVFVPRRFTLPWTDDVPATIKEVIRLNEAESALRALKKSQRAKIAKGEIDFDAYEQRVSALEKTVADLHARVRPAADAPPAAVLSSGTEMKPWARAMVGMNYGLLLGIPWLALLLHRFQSGFAPDRGYDWVQSIAIALTAMAQWPLLGFFFGYFYPHLRGNTGLTKGLFMFLSVVTPIFAATALTLPADKQTLTLFFFSALQLLIHCMLLGFFAGDYETLRASGLSWRHVLDVHNLGSITAWTSTLVIAVGAAVATEFTTKASKFIVQALQAAVPDLPRTQ